MKLKRFRPAALMAMLGLMAALLAHPGRLHAQSGDSIVADTFGAYVNTLGASLAQSPVAVLDPTTGMADDSLANVSVPGVLDASSLQTIATGAIGENAATSQSSSTAQNVNILGGIVRAEGLVAMANSQANGAVATSNAVGSTLVGLVVNGVPLGDVLPAPNTQIDVPGVGSVILNEQTFSGDGVTSSGLNVNLIHVVLMQSGLFGSFPVGDIIVGSAHSAISFQR